MQSLGALTRGIASLLGYTVALPIPTEGNGPFDPLTATAADLRRFLAEETVSSVFLVEQYLTQIEAYNKKEEINAVILSASREDLIERARCLDDERADGHVRGRMHGIPVLVESHQDDAVLDVLTKAGVIVIGRIVISSIATSSEDDETDTHAVYSFPGLVATGLTPIIIVVSDINGCISQRGWYGMEAQKTSDTTPRLGATAKTPQDVADMMEILTGVTKGRSAPSKISWEGMRIGYVDPALIQPVGDELSEDLREEIVSPQCRAMASAMIKVSVAGACVLRSVSLRTLEDLAECEDVFILAKDRKDMMGGTRDSASPAGRRSDTITAITKANRNLAQTCINQTFNEWGVDVIMGPVGNGIARVAAAAGYPVGVVPLRFAKVDGNGEGAEGVQVIARPGEEGTMMIRVMRAWEKSFPLADMGKALELPSPSQQQETTPTSDDGANAQSQQPSQHEPGGRGMQPRSRTHSKLTAKEKTRILDIASRMEKNMTPEDKAKIARELKTLSPQRLQKYKAQGITPLQAFCRMSVTETFLEK